MSTASRERPLNQAHRLIQAIYLTLIPLQYISIQIILYFSTLTIGDITEMLGTKFQEKLRQDNTSALNRTLLYPYASFMGK